MKTLAEIFRQEAEHLIIDAEDMVGVSFNEPLKAKAIDIVTARLRDAWESAYDDACAELENEYPYLTGGNK